MRPKGRCTGHTLPVNPTVRGFKNPSKLGYTLNERAISDYGPSNLPRFSKPTGVLLSFPLSQNSNLHQTRSPQSSQLQALPNWISNPKLRSLQSDRKLWDTEWFGARTSASTYFVLSWSWHGVSSRAVATSFAPSVWLIRRNHWFGSVNCLRPVCSFGLDMRLCRDIEIYDMCAYTYMDLYMYIVHK